MCCLSSKESARSGTLRWLYYLQLEGKENDAAAKTAGNTFAASSDSDSNSMSNSYYQQYQAQFLPG